MTLKRNEPIDDLENKFDLMRSPFESDYQYLYHILKIRPKQKNELKVALTHLSFSPNGQNNSRYVFIGTSESKAVAARILYAYKAGTGMQLQHTLGNAFSQKVLHAKFDQWRLKDYIRHHDFDTEHHKHIFVYAILGFVSQHYTSDVFRDLILREFITDQSLSEHSAMRFNPKSILELLVVQKYDEKLKMSITLVSAGYECHITTGTTTLSQHISKSKEYARKRAITKAIKYITSQDADAVEPLIRSRKTEIKQYEKQKKAESHALFLQKQLEIKKKRDERILKTKIEREKIAQNRRKSKESVKTAKERRKEQKLVITEGMNAAKRRRIEDKLK